MIERSGRIAHHVLAFLLLFSTSLAFALDAPHTNLPGYGIECGSCHWTQSSATPPWSSVQNPPAPADDTINNRRCYTCHDGSKSAIPGVKTHSSSTTGSAYWSAKGGWKTECVTCHDPHQQRQTRAWGTLTYIVTGPPPVIGNWETGNRTQITVAGTLTQNYYGYYLLPDKNYPFYYKIATDTTDTDTFKVKGDVLEQYVKTGGYAIVYGKNVREYINYANPGGTPVGGTIKLYDQSGANGPGDSANASNSVCYVCHKTANHWSSAGDTVHNDRGKCKECHTHPLGFEPTCANCHGGPPVVDAAAPPNGLVWTTVTGSATAGAHNTHVNVKGIVCSACHYNSVAGGPTHNDGSITMGFNNFGGTTQGGAYDGQASANYDATATTPATSVSKLGSKSCSNVYCHGASMSPNGGSNVTPVWDDPSTAVCGTCHGATAASPPTRGSHQKHVGSASGYSFECSLCHTDVATAGKHVAGSVAWSINATDPRTSGGMYKGSSSGATGQHAPSASYGSCSNLYCHSNGTSVSTGTIPGNTSPTWGTPGPLACDSCHGSGTGNGMPNYPNGSPKANTHAAHVNKQSHWNGPTLITCKTCHFSTTTDDTTIADKLLHVNHKYDVKANGSQQSVYIPVSFIYTPLPTGGQCFSVSCHRGTTVYWGGPSMGSCGSAGCHASNNPFRGTETLVSLSVSPSNPRVEVNKQQQFTASGTFSNTMKKDATIPVTWTSSNPAIATIDRYGLATAGPTTGTTTITASLNGLSSSATLEVTPSLVSITVTPGDTSIPFGQTEQFAATAKYSDGSTVDITNWVKWQSSNTAVAAINGAGLASSVGEGTANISATLGTVSSNTSLIVEPARLTSITVTPPNQALLVGTTQQFTATGTYTDNSVRDVSSQAAWSSSNPAVASIDTYGLATAIATGPTTITAAIGPISGSATLSVVSFRGAIGALYPNNGGNWNDYVKNDGANSFSATDTACTGTETGGYTVCLHGGEMRKVDVIGKSACNGLTAVDALDAFNWVCDSGTGTVRMVSTGLKDGKMLTDLIDFSGTPKWRSNNVTVYADGNPYLSLPASKVELYTTSTGGGAAATYNNSQIYLKDPGVVQGDFDIQVDYSLPDGQITSQQYQVYTRLQIDFPNTAGGANQAYVEREAWQGSNYYNGVIRVDGTVRQGAAPPSYAWDTSGKLRIQRVGSAINAYAWTQGTWALIQQAIGASTAAAVHVTIQQYAQTNEPVSLKADIDNFILSNSAGTVLYDDFSSGIDSAVWGQYGWVNNTSGGGTLSATPPVSITDGRGSARISPAYAPWWNNPIVTINPQSPNFYNAGTVYILPVNTYIYPFVTIYADKEAVVTAPSAAPGTVAPQVAIVANTYKFLWIEGNYDKHESWNSINLGNVNQSVVRNVRSKGSVSLYNSSNNKITHYSADCAGLVLTNSSFNTASNITVAGSGSGCGNGVSVNNSSNNTFEDMEIAGAMTGVYLTSSSKNTFKNLISANNGTGLDIAGTNNTFSNIIASDGGISIGGSNNRFIDVTSFNSSNGISLAAYSSNNFISNMSSAYNAGYGLNVPSSSFNSLINISISNNVTGLFDSDSYYSGYAGRNMYRNLAVADNRDIGISLYNSPGNYFTGLLKVGNNGQAGNCSVYGGTNPGLISGTCANNGQSDAALVTGITLTPSFIGKSSHDSVNPGGGTGAALYDSITDWTHFENAYRGWGADLDYRGACISGMTCRILDWSLLASDTTVRGVLPIHLTGNAEDVLTHTWSAAGEADCNAIDGATWNSGLSTCTTTFLRNAVEIFGDGIGNENGLCESNETCLYTPNIGSYQGEGSLISAGAFSDGAILTGITLMQYGTNGH